MHIRGSMKETEEYHTEFHANNAYQAVNVLSYHAKRENPNGTRVPQSKEKANSNFARAEHHYNANAQSLDNTRIPQAQNHAPRTLTTRRLQNQLCYPLMC